MLSVPLNTGHCRSGSFLPQLLPPPSSSGSPQVLTVTLNVLLNILNCLVWSRANRGPVLSERCTVTQLLRGKSLSICRQMTDCSICPDALVTLRRNQSIYSITALCDISPHKGPLQAVGFGLGTLSVARRNLPRVPGEQA